MRRVMYLFLPSWPIDRLRRLNKDRAGSTPSLGDGGPADKPFGEPPFATVIAAVGLQPTPPDDRPLRAVPGVTRGGRHLIAAVNPAAAAAGLAPGMPLADALSFLPQLATAAAEPMADAAALGRLAEWCTRYSPWTASDGADGVKLEITGCAHLWGGEAALAADLARRLLRQKIDHRIAIAGNVGAAWALARFAAGEGKPALPGPDEERAALMPLPVEALRLDPATAAGLRRVGLRRVGELAPMPRDALARRFGEAVWRRLDQALGDLPEPLSPLGEAPARRVRLSFAEPIADPADLARAAERLADDLVARLAREGMGARRLALAFHRVDGRVEHIRLATARPSRDPHHLAGLLASKLDTIDPGLGVEDMILAVFAAEPLPAEQIRMDLPPERPPWRPAVRRLPSPPIGGRGFTGGGGRENNFGAGIAPLLDRLGARFGPAALGHIALRASHIPERAAVYVPVGEDKCRKLPVIPGPPGGRNPESTNTGRPHPTLPRKRGRVGWGNRDSGFAAAQRPGMTGRKAAGNIPKPPRPVRLFAPPEPIAAAWLLPDDPPFRFTWRRRSYRVRRADGPERIAEEWWTAGGSGAADAIRDYYRVEDAEGRRFWLFRAGLPGDPPPRWFVHGVFA